MDRTRILLPILKDEDEEMCADMKTKINEFNKQIDNELDHNSANISSFDDLLERMSNALGFEVDVNFYVLATRKTIKRPKIFLKRAPRDCRSNAYNKKILLLMRSNMDIQFVLDAYACVGYIVDYINKSSRGLSRLLRLCIEDCRKGNKTIQQQMKACCDILYNSREVSAQEAAWLGLRLPMCVTTICVEFIHSGPPESRQKMLKNYSELEKLPPNSTDIYRQGLIDRYALRSDEMEPLCLAEFGANYTFCNNRGKSNEVINEEEPVEEVDVEALPDSNEIDDDDDETPSDRHKLKSFPLKDDSGIMKERKKPKVIRYCRFCYHKEPENYFREMCLLFLPWRNEESDISEKNCQELYLANEEVIKLNYQKFNASELDFDSIAREIEQDRIIEDIARQVEEQNRGNDDENQAETFLNAFDFDANIIQPNAAQEMGLETTSGETVSKYTVPGILEKEEYFKLMDSLNEEQRDIAMDINSLVMNNKIPFHYFITGGAGTGKTQTIKALFQSLTRHYRSTPSEDISPEILIVSFTGMAAHNVSGMTAHSAFHLPCGTGEIKPLDPSVKNTLRSNLLNLKVLIIDEISMMSAKHLDQISFRLREIFGTPQVVHFGGISVIVVGDFNQLPPVGGRLAFQTKNTTTTAVLAGSINPQWALFKVHRLNKIMRQRDDLVFAEALNRLAAGKCTPEDIEMWNKRVFKEENLPEEARNATRLYEFHTHINEYNRVVVDKKRATAKFDITSKAEDRFVGTLTTTQRNQAQNALKKLTADKAQGLPAELELVDNVRYMVTVNIDVSDGLYNGALGTLRRIDFEEIPGKNQTKSAALWIEFDCQSIGIEARRQKKAHMIANKISDTWTPINRLNKQFNLLDKGSVKVNRLQYPLVVAESRTIHKSQGLTVDTVVLDAKGRNLTREKAYTAISRSRTLNGVFIIDKFTPTRPPHPNDPVVGEMMRMEESCKIIPRFQELRIRNNEHIKLISHNVQSLKAHLLSIINDTTYTNSDLMLLQESWLKSSNELEITSFSEITRNHLISASGMGTIIYGKTASNLQFSDIPAIEERESIGHCEITGIVVDADLLLLNIYKNPTCKRDTFMKAIEQYADLIHRFDNVLAMGDFNDNVKSGSSFNKLMAEIYNLELFSPQEPTTTNQTCIDAVFGKLKDYNISCKIYMSYFSVHFPIVTKLFKK
jgi:ATP-dependent exoDNAse (exonuclease V) alpha subunit